MSSASVLSSGHSTAAPLYDEDVLLARACASGATAAIVAFEDAHMADLRIVHQRMRGSKPPFDEFVQVVRTKLFVGPAPRIAEYSGVGALKNWVRVVGARTLIEMARKTKDTVELEESGVLPVCAPNDDPEMEYLKRRYATGLKDAFEDAARMLDAEERNVLREHYAGGLGIDQIAAVHGIHRATAARRLSGARESVLKNTRQLLMQRLRISRAELESVVRMMESRLDVSIERVFAP